MPGFTIVVLGKEFGRDARERPKQFAEVDAKTCLSDGFGIMGIGKDYYG